MSSSVVKRAGRGLTPFQAGIGDDPKGAMSASLARAATSLAKRRWLSGYSGSAPTSTSCAVNRKPGPAHPQLETVRACLRRDVPELRAFLTPVEIGKDRGPAPSGQCKMRGNGGERVERHRLRQGKRLKEIGRFLR